MRRISKRIIVLVSFLITGIYTVNAKQPEKFGHQEELLVALSKENNYNYLQDKDVINKKLEKINTYQDLSIPKAENEVRIRSLSPLTLNQIEKLVEENSPSLKILKNRINQSKELLKASLSKWYPTINLTANGLPEYFSSNQYRNPSFGNDTKTKQWKSTVNIRVQWNLIDPGRIPAIKSAKDSYEKAKDAYLIALRDQNLSAARQYFLLQRADEGVRIGKQSMKASLLSLRDAKARFDAGVATRLEVLEAETQLARDKQLLTGKLGDQKITRRALAATLNLAPDITPIASTSAQVIGTWKASLEESIISAFAFREELNQLLLDISINNNNANISLADIQPIISLFNSLSYSKNQGQASIPSGSSIDMDDYASSLSNSIGINATWKIFDGGKSKANYNYHKLKAEESKLSFDVQKAIIRQEVEESFFRLRTASQDIATTTREVLAARESLRLARLRFQAGVATQREVVNNQRDLTQAEVRYSDAITTYNTSLSQLQRRTGIDHIKACKAKSIKLNETKNKELIDIPLEPFPLIPACEASTLKREE